MSDFFFLNLNDREIFWIGGYKFRKTVKKNLFTLLSSFPPTNPSLLWFFLSPHGDLPGRAPIFKKKKKLHWLIDLRSIWLKRNLIRVVCHFDFLSCLYELIERNRTTSNFGWGSRRVTPETQNWFMRRGTRLPRNCDTVNIILLPRQVPNKKCTLIINQILKRDAICPLFLVLGTRGDWKYFPNSVKLTLDLDANAFSSTERMH